ncbi:L,D-transpeptidase catalytic domain [Tranquillimonas rosea]|uniref:L,D-transpeptidase catalytic domain n=1 Tax=Tranquillimonas rosea TaxID=641238 RepID=A0A1H9RM56_9RHOB|nr:L,D-transpeptidase [Tranquillimonas rosea]SER73826.1 L,D-transpeptidase catalytic domain [Tranquillimonas rosea]
MLSRRQFLATTTAALAAPAVHAQTADPRDANLVDLPAGFAPARVNLQTEIASGEIHVVPDQYRLYWTLPDFQAIRYFVGVGRDRLYESGEFYVGAKKEYPSWTPTPDMIEREPDHYGQYEDGMPGGPTNPLGARALYLFQPDRGDTFLRIHGTHKPDTIGFDVSNGCARLVNAQIVDLYDRVPMDSRVVLHPKDIPNPIV